MVEQTASWLKRIRWMLLSLLDDARALVAEVRSTDDVEPIKQQDLDYVSSASRSVLLQTPGGARLITWTIFWFFILAFIWAALAGIDEYTHGVGKVVPSRHVQIVQNLEGGILAELYVGEGDTVEVGQPLLRIDDTLFSSSYREQAQHVNQLKIQMLRLQAETKGEIFTLPKDVTPELRELYVQEESLFKSRRQEVRAKENKLLHSYDLVNRELQMMKPLLAQGAISEVELLRLQRQASELAGELSSFRSETHSKIQGELNKVTDEYTRLNQTTHALEDRVKRTTVRSPVSGQVKQLMVKTIGGVIQPGMDILEVVPVGDKLLVEARVSPADIAFLHPGQRAIVKVTAYDFAVHGGLEGSLVNISPDTLIDENGDSYYLIKVETDRGYFGDSEQESLPIIPGMTVEVDIVTGKKTVLQYLFHPILRAKARALSER